MVHVLPERSETWGVFVVCPIEMGIQLIDDILAYNGLKLSGKEVMISGRLFSVERIGQKAFRPALCNSHGSTYISHFACTG